MAACFAESAERFVTNAGLMALAKLHKERLGNVEEDFIPTCRCGSGIFFFLDAPTYSDAYVVHLPDRLLWALKNGGFATSAGRSRRIVAAGEPWIRALALPSGFFDIICDWQLSRWRDNSRV